MKFLYYFVVYPFSKLPIGLLYFIGHFLYFILYRFIGYRREVVRNNLINSFPELELFEIKIIEKRYYHYLSQMIIESVKNLSISKENLAKRVQVKNPEVLDKIYEEGKSVILAGAHYLNWEYLITAQNFLFKHQAVGIGKPLSSSFWNTKMNKIRERYGMRVIHSKNFKEKLEEWSNEKIALLVLFDQSPSGSQYAYWHNFLNQKTAFLFGAENLAKKYNFPVVQYKMTESKKGYYRISLELISDEPKKTAEGEITKKLIENLEDQILESPAFWLWSHKRWKRKAPAEV